jgi:hypothetical protein
MMNRIGFASAWMITMVAVAAAQAAEPVRVTIEKMTFRLETAEYRNWDTPQETYHFNRDTLREITDTVEVIRLNNGIVEAWVCPAYAGRLIRAFDVKTGQDYFRWGEPFQDRLPWSTGPGGVKASFPFFEHGTQLRQPAGHRIVRHTDGSVTVACDQRYTHFQRRADMQRYGRYGDESLNVMVTVRPGTSVVQWRQRKENPNPLPRSDRMWNDVLYPQDRVTKKAMVRDRRTGEEVERDVADEPEMKKRTTFIYPARYVVDHGPRTVHTSPHGSSPDNWGVSHFAVDAPYGFAGGYYPQKRLNLLMLHDTDPERGPSLKLYTASWSDFFELWGGQGYVFESPGKLRPAFEPVEFVHRFYIAQNIGEVSFANEHVAVSVNDKHFEMIATRAAGASVADSAGKTVASGRTSPHEVLRGEFDGRRLVVALDGRTVLDQTFPLDRPEPVKDAPIPDRIRKLFEQLRAHGDDHFERNLVANNPGLPTSRGAIAAAAAITECANPARAMSIARTVYRLGHLDEAERLANLCGGPDADYLNGLIGWERGQPVDFKSAGWASNYMRALQAIQKNDTAAALKWVDGYLQQVPNAWHPRLAKAYWARDKALARALADENPGSPEAQLVLKLLGEAHDLDALRTNNPSADEHVNLFEAQLTRGQWQHLPRFGPALPKPPAR